MQATRLLEKQNIHTIFNQNANLLFRNNFYCKNTFMTIYDLSTEGSEILLEISENNGNKIKFVKIKDTNMQA